VILTDHKLRVECFENSTLKMNYLEGLYQLQEFFFSATASEAERFMAVVVLPTPPFWFATDIILPCIYSTSIPKNHND